MVKMGRPAIEGKKIVLKVSHDLLEEVDEVWPKLGFISRNDFIRRVVWEEVQRSKVRTMTNPKP